MRDFKKLPLDAQLAALIDGEAGPEEKHELEARLARDEGARRLYEQLRHGGEFGRHRFGEILKEPVPLALVRSIKSVQPPKAPVAPRVAKSTAKFAPTARQSAIAGLALLGVGLGVGYLVSQLPSPPTTIVNQVATPAPAPSNWLSDITAYHRLILRQPRHLVEVAANQKEEISSWLTSSVGVAFRIPDLSSQGWTFQGARVILADGRPAGQLIYTGNDGDVISIVFRKDNQPAELEDFKEAIRDELGLVSWHNAGNAYVLVGPSAEASLNQLAADIATAI
ncbi:anti-sigma factor family protein [Oryzifoliimicrobium ureilyticus]|uniref:anti-sigma factor family protein n=1 Tax=Oryzifoliimicrobium ureilyticus TaxID=3113724 RepID=UPI0030765FDB